MATTPSFEAFSRFQKLNVRNLLYYQIELKEMERALEKRELGDMHDQNPSEKDFIPSAIHQSPEVMINKKSIQWGRVKKLRETLRNYSRYLSSVCNRDMD